MLKYFNNHLLDYSLLSLHLDHENRLAEFVMVHTRKGYPFTNYVSLHLKWLER